MTEISWLILFMEESSRNVYITIQRESWSVRIRKREVTRKEAREKAEKEFILRSSSGRLVFNLALV